MNGYVSWIEQLNEKTATHLHAQRLMELGEARSRKSSGCAARRIAHRAATAYTRRMRRHMIIDTAFVFAMVVSLIAAFAAIAH